MNKFNSQQKIGEIAASFPNVTEIFKEYKIDFCCGGDRPLINAIKAQGINEQEIMNRINSEYEKLMATNQTKDIQWTSAPINQLVDHILNTHHAYLYENLPKISELTTTILRVHGANHPELFEVHKLFHNLKTDLESHLIKEETIQYPAIRKYLETNEKKDLDMAISIINTLENEHTTAGDILKQLRKITNNYHIPEDVCGTFCKTYNKLEEMEADLFQHIHLENNILFPRLKNIK